MKLVMAIVTRRISSGPSPFSIAVRSFVHIKTCQVGVYCVGQCRDMTCIKAATHIEVARGLDQRTQQKEICQY